MVRNRSAALLVGSLVIASAGCGQGGSAAPATTTVIVATRTSVATSAPAPAPTTARPTTAAPTTSATASPTPPLPAEGGGLPLSTYSYAEALERVRSLNTGADRAGEFVNHDRTVYCALVGDGTSPGVCELLVPGSMRAPSVCGSGGDGSDRVGRVAWHGDSLRPECNSDTMASDLAGVPVLQRHQVARVTGVSMQCMDEDWGVTCVDTVAHKAFSLGRAGYLVAN